MALTKSGSNIVSSQSSSAGSSADAVNSGDVDVSGAYQAVIAGKVTNGATGPTVGCTVNVYVSRDTTNYFLFQTIVTGVTNSAVYHFVFTLPDSTTYAKIGFGGNTAQAVTVIADLHKITAI